jgi:adenylylsulfate kinase
MKTYVLDGDNIRHGINKNLSFTPEDRSENIRRIAEISKLFIDAGTIVIGSFISPYEKDRIYVKDIVGNENYIEVYVNTSVEECERRDVKGLYKKARNGEIKNFTGIDAPYEVPICPDIEIKTEEESIKEAVLKIVKHIQNKITYNG